MAAKADRVAANDRVGQLPARYLFLLNPYRDIRLSKCPRCDRPTHARKFPLVVRMDQWGLLVLGKTCRYCTRCELIIAHQDELEQELTNSMTKLAPRAIGGEYLVLGTIDKKVWQQNLGGASLSVDEALKHMADFKKYLDLEVNGGWSPA